MISTLLLDVLLGQGEFNGDTIWSKAPVREEGVRLFPRGRASDLVERVGQAVSQVRVLPSMSPRRIPPLPVPPHSPSRPRSSSAVGARHVVGMAKALRLPGLPVSAAGGRGSAAHEHTKGGEAGERGGGVGAVWAGKGRSLPTGRLVTI